ncbi:MAG TPA: DUF1800 domain-containing protein [Aliidongia sp.]|nr:DUF1800 domain-containing protein [Aliidongia sp.]
MNEAIIAAARFGYGAGPNGSNAGTNPRQWLKAQLARPARPPALDGLPSSAEQAVAIFELRKERQQAKQAGELADAKQEMSPERMEQRQRYLAEIAARLSAATDSETPLIERLSIFWANHFTVSGVRPIVRPLVGSFEREAIRPHVTGKFEEMVLAVVRHPAMGLYLDNAVSVGPNSRVGARRDRGLNENLGRELLELHTLGVDGGYTEEDVRALARILTGWSIGRLKDPDPGHFHFYEPIHEPGPKTLLGHTYPENGEGEGLAAIHDICRHPSTARHIATKLARHFIADQPPPGAVEKLAASFRESDGDLRHVTETLIDLPEAWSLYQQKVKTPWDLVVSAAVATGSALPVQQAAGWLNRLGQPVFMAPQPSGWPDDAASWVGPEAVLRRVEWCQSFADRFQDQVDPLMLANYAIGDSLSPDAHQAAERAESRSAALALLLASPAFQRR